MRRLAGLAALVAALLAGCGPGARPILTAERLGAETVPSTAPASYTRLVATVPERLRQIEVLPAPGAPAPRWTLSNPNDNGVERVFLVKTDQPEWLEVLVPVRPNGSAGWIRRSDVDITSTDFRVKVELAAHRITVWKGSEVFHTEPVGIGTTATPTPRGDYYLTELLQPTDAQGRVYTTGPYGPYAFGISGYSEELKEFAGGPGQVGIHGTNDPSGLGKDVSHGCIRLSNEGITKLAKALPLGTPVEIVA